MPSSSEPTTDPVRLEAARRVIDEIVDRGTGGSIDDQAVIAAHQDLMPELDRELLKLRRIKMARMIAESMSGDPDADPIPSPSPASALPSDSFPGYRLLGEIHRGGQGVVYEAVQDNTERPVAIKVMRGGPFAGRHDQARFEREVQILGKLQHPEIVAIHESGIASGNAYFVMDYIPGMPLDEHVRETAPSIDQTLELMATIAEAVNVAHLRGIIHRDLKPGNIRVDRGGRPHILDFGLAKMSAIEAGRAVTEMTVSGQFIGSLPWTSPEQARGEIHTIDVRSDVYSLGVILYQMLTDRFPYEIEGHISEVLDRIIDTEPVRPRTLRADLNDEVETILLKCLNKDPARRYQSAGELARDIRHYLAREPIEAKRDSTWYVFRKTARRYRIPLAIAAAFMVTVSVCAVVFAVLYNRAIAAELVAEERRVESVREAQTARQVLGSLQQLFQTLDPAHAGGSDVTIRQVLDSGVNDVVAELEGNPEVLVPAMEFVAETYESHGYYQSAVPWRERIMTLRSTVLPENAKHIATSIYNLANACYESADYQRAEPLYREAIAMAEDQFGSVHLLTATYRSGLGILLQSTGRYDEAGPLLRDVLDVRIELLGELHPTVAGSMTNLALVRQATGDFETAETLLRDAVESRRRVLGDDHLQVADSLLHLASVIRLQSRYDEVEPLYREAYEIRLHTLGDRHPEVAGSMHSLGTLLKDMSRYDEAEPFYARALEIRREVYGDRHPEVALTLNNYANLKEVQGDRAAAVSMHREALDIQRRLFGDQHPQIATGLHNLARVLAATGDVQEAERLYHEALEIRRQRPNHPDVAVTLMALASLLPVPERYDDAEALLAEALELQRRRLGDRHRDVAGTLNQLAILNARVGHHARAVDSMTEALAIYRDVFEDDHLYVGVVCGNLAGMMLNIDADAEAEPLFREALRIHRVKLAETHERTARLESTFGKCLIRLAKYDEAETVLLHSHDTLAKARGPEHGLTRLTVRRLVDLYDAWGRIEQADEWRARLPTDSESE